MKSVAKEIISRLAGYSDDEVFEVIKLIKAADNSGLWYVVLKEPKEKEEKEVSEGGAK